MDKCQECEVLIESPYDICQSCCEHDFDIDEGYMCLHCGKQGDYGELIDAAQAAMEDR